MTQSRQTGRNRGVDAKVNVVKPPEHRGVAEFARSTNASVLPIPGVQGRGPQPCGCAGRRSNVGEDALASKSQRQRG